MGGGGAREADRDMTSDVLTTRAPNRATLARQMVLLAWPPFIGLWSRVQGFQPEHLMRPVNERKIVRATGGAAFAVAESWVGARIGDEGDPRDLVLRYLAAFGPARVRDAETWSYLKGLGPAFEALRPKLRVFRDERGRELFDLPRAPRPPEKTPAPVRFLPDYDNLLLPPTFLVDGFAAGSWKIQRARATASLLLEPFEALPRQSRAELVEAGEALARFVEPDAERFEVRFA
jgi:hypothetical protein